MSILPSKPKLVFAMSQGLAPLFFGAAQKAQLGAVADVLSVESYTDFSTLEAAALLRQAGIMVGAWGAAPLDAAILAQAPNLRVHGGAKLGHGASAFELMRAA